MYGYAPVMINALTSKKVTVGINRMWLQAVGPDVEENLQLGLYTS